MITSAKYRESNKMNQAIFTKFKKDVRTCIINANEVFGTTIDPNSVDVRFDIKGKAAGQAIRRGSKLTLRFNPEAIINFNHDTTTNTIPHEVAHLVCFVKPSLGRNHDRGWKAVCRRLGGDDSRTHEMELTNGRDVYRYEYNVNGTIVLAGPKHHKRIQAVEASMSTFSIKRTGERLNRDHYVRALVNGKPVETVNNSVESTPIQRAASNPSTHSRSRNITKRQQAEYISIKNPNASRQELIALFMSELNMSKAGASTYYYNVKNKK